MALDPTRKYGRLQPIRLVRSVHRRIGRGSKFYWECRCDCGTVKEVEADGLLYGKTMSCGCHRREQMRSVAIKHGKSKTCEWRVWADMHKRCRDPNSKNYQWYGGRGIRVDPAWAEFEPFLRDMGERPSPAHQLDRIDNDGSYGPGNCRWATRKEQARNKRDNHNLTLNGRTQPIVDWAEETGLDQRTIWMRLKRGWSVERALTEPLVRGRPRSGNANDKQRSSS